MSTVELREKAKKRIDKMPAKHLRSTMQYMDYLIEMGSRPPLQERLKQADREMKAGLGTPWEKLRRKSKPKKLSADDKRKIANMRRWIREADRDLAEGRTVNWRDVRRDV